jgi:hypothetical protein
MSPIPPNKALNETESSNINEAEATDTEQEIVVVNSENNWDPNYYNINYSGVTYEQLNQDQSYDIANESDDENEQNEKDPDLDFEFLACSRVSMKKENTNNLFESNTHLFEKDFFEKKKESECEEIFLDETKSKTINSLMSNFNLPENCIPTWAKQIPENEWKTNLIASLNAKKTDLFQTNIKLSD